MNRQTCFQDDAANVLIWISKSIKSHAKEAMGFAEGKFLSHEDVHFQMINMKEIRSLMCIDMITSYVVPSSCLAWRPCRTRNVSSCSQLICASSKPPATWTLLRSNLSLHGQEAARQGWGQSAWVEGVPPRVWEAYVSFAPSGRLWMMVWTFRKIAKMVIWWSGRSDGVIFRVVIGSKPSNFWCFPPRVSDHSVWSLFISKCQISDFRVPVLGHHHVRDSGLKIRPCHAACCAARDTQTVVRAWCVLYILTWK